MENCYSHTLVPASKSRDGETPTRLFVTEEINFFALCYEDSDTFRVIAIYRYRDDAIRALFDRLASGRGNDAGLVRI